MSGKQEIECDRDAACRRKVTTVHNRLRPSFATALEHDDYVEMIEDLIYKLSRGGPEAKNVDEQLKAHQVSTMAVLW